MSRPIESTLDAVADQAGLVGAIGGDRHVVKSQSRHRVRCAAVEILDVRECRIERTTGPVQRVGQGGVPLQDVSARHAVARGPDHESAPCGRYAGQDSGQIAAGDPVPTIHDDTLNRGPFALHRECGVVHPGTVGLNILRSAFQQGNTVLGEDGLRTARRELEVIQAQGARKPGHRFSPRAPRPGAVRPSLKCWQVRVRRLSDNSRDDERVGTGHYPGPASGLIRRRLGGGLRTGQGAGSCWVGYGGGTRGASTASVACGKQKDNDSPCGRGEAMRDLHDRSPCPLPRRRRMPGRCRHHTGSETVPTYSPRLGELPRAEYRAVLFSGRPDSAGPVDVCKRDCERSGWARQQ